MEREINICLEVLRKGGSIVYPTDTVWGLGCDATSDAAVDRIYKIKHRIDSKSMIILLHDASLLPHYVREVPDLAHELMNIVDKPLTIIYPEAINLPANLIAADGSIAIRIVRNPFCSELIRRFGKPIVSTSANISGDPSPVTFKNISPVVLQAADHVVELDQDLIREVKPSRIIRLLENGEFNIIRP